jgi:hypothetical protein
MCQRPAGQILKHVIVFKKIGMHHHATGGGGGANNYDDDDDDGDENDRIVA